ncbi:TetR/AcrR family transcriptional regulator [Pseudomonas sp. Irchel s3b5]|uniref:TetR/AcrR family transcriptional regulator n=1 Tax=Pseudomonas sp. Irchel s3b5 TaxID=2009077 RepID=UPI000BA35A5A|nr:TetR/AcrR family transcriptional regulator [Pseudomonas sp. Irchel s3b5]
MSALLSNVEGGTRDRIIDAAIALFSEYGFQAISMRDLAKQVGVNAGSLYNHIENKQELLYEILELTLSSLIATTKRSTKRQGTPERKFQAFLQSFSSFRGVDERGLILLYREVVSLDVKRQTDIRDLQQSYLSLLEDILSPMYFKSVPGRLSYISKIVVGFLFGQLQWSSAGLHDKILMAHLIRFVTESASQNS